MRSALAALTLVGILWSSGGPVAQATSRPQSRPHRHAAPQRWVAFDRYHERRSRAAFSACDRDGDDRLDVREARACLTGMGDADDPTGFRALDLNRNGFLHWSEFDQRYRTLVRRGGSFRFRPARPFTAPATNQRPDQTAASRQQRAAELVVGMANLDDDPDINKAEFRGLLKALGQPTTLSSSFDVVDLDRSGGLSKAEFVPILNAVPYLAQLVLAQSDKAGPSVLRPADLGRRLARMHPVLHRWNRSVFRAADRNGDGILDATELRTTATRPQSTKRKAP